MAMADFFGNWRDAVSDPARRMFLIAPSDTVELDILPKAIRAGGAGNITLRAIGSTEDVTITVALGEIIPVRARYIRAAGTNVAVIHGLA